MNNLRRLFNRPNRWRGQSLVIMAVALPELAGGPALVPCGSSSKVRGDWAGGGLILVRELGERWRFGELIQRPLAACGKENIGELAAVLAFSTLHKSWLLSLIFSPSGRDKSEGAGGGNPFFRSLLERDHYGGQR